MFKKIVLVVSISLLSACSSLDFQEYVKRPQVDYQSIEVSKIAADGITLNPTFSVENNNGFPLPINSVDYTLSLNDQTMLAGETDAVGTLPANDTKDITLSLDLKKETLLSLQKLLSETKQFDYKIAGNVNTMGLSIPFEKSATLYVPEVTNMNFKVINANFDQFDIILSLDIENKNDFALPLENINYLVSSNQKSLFEGRLESQEISQGKNHVELPLSIKPNDLFTNIFSLLLNPNTPLHFEINSPLFTKSYDHNVNLGAYFQ